jgi:hypothetical protein
MNKVYPLIDEYYENSPAPRDKLFHSELAFKKCFNMNKPKLKKTFEKSKLQFSIHDKKKLFN